MSILPASSGEPRDSGCCAIAAPQRHDAIGGALVRAFPEHALVVLPGEMQALIVRLDQLIDPVEARA